MWWLCLMTIFGEIQMPFAQAGLDEHRAAVHLIDRLGYGPSPGDIEAMVAMGLNTWLERQLEAGFPDETLAAKLSAIPLHGLTPAQINETYLSPARLARLAVEEGLLEDDGNIRENRDLLRRFGRENGYRLPRDLAGELIARRIYRAVYGKNQVREVLTDFWYNHFYVSLRDNQAMIAIPHYEESVIRAGVFGHFEEMLQAVAKHPAMLIYLDAAASTSESGTVTTASMAMGRKPPSRNRESRRGINENYARELMELHTLGVDGGYAQEDIVEVARALTGWTVMPPDRDDLVRRMARPRIKRAGFVHQGDFLFRAGTHDAGPKEVLGVRFPAGGGLEEGEAVLGLLADHPSTARFVTTKFARAFVSEETPAELLTALAKSFRESKGDLRELVITLVEHPAFWSPETLEQKVKSPFRLAVSAVRALDGDVGDIRRLSRWIERMGEPLYRYPAPTGFPDRADFWINSGSLTNRIAFAEAAARGRVTGVSSPKPKLKPMTPEAIAALLLPGRETTEMLAVLKRARQHDRGSNGITWAASIMASPAFQRH